MGKQFHIETRTMKFLVVLALVAAAYAAPEAEANANADPAYFYGNYYGYPSYYSGYGYSGYASPYWGGYYNRGYGYWKREAGAEPEAKADASADPAYWYGNYGWGSPYYNSYAYNNWGWNRAYAYPAYNYYNRFWKRSADAQPEADADANPEAYWYGNAYGFYGNRWGYSGYYRPYGYNWGYRRYGGYWW